MALLIKLLCASTTSAGGNPSLAYSSTGHTIVGNVRLATTGTVGSANVYFCRSGTSTDVRVLEKNKALAANDVVLVKPEITMGPGDLIKVSTSVAMECVISGFTLD